MFSSGLDPLLLGHRLVADDVVSGDLIEVLDVSPLAGTPVLEPEAASSNIARQCFAIQAFDVHQDPVVPFCLRTLPPGLPGSAM